MNRWQFARQAKFTLQNATFSGSAVKVFAQNSVLVSMMEGDAIFETRQIPLAVVIPLGEEIDPQLGESPDLAYISFEVALFNAVLGDDDGENVLLGANRQSDGGNRGLLEIEASVKAALLQLGGDTGFPITYRGSGCGPVIRHPSLGYINSTLLEFRAKGTTFATYEPPFGLAATGGSGSASLSWSASPRFDAYKFVLRRASGTTPPATISDGTGVTLSGDLATSVTNSGLAAGVYSYSLFLQYDDTDSGGATLSTSDPQTVRVTVT